MRLHTLAAVVAVMMLQAQPSDTVIVIGDGGSLLMRADGLDSGNNWNKSAAELRHRSANGVLRSLRVMDNGTDRCAANANCGADLTRAWRVEIAYGNGGVTVGAINVHRGVRIVHRNMPFDQWKATGSADQRVFGQGDGRRISSIRVNGGENLCGGNGCQVVLSFSPRD